MHNSIRMVFKRIIFVLFGILALYLSGCVTAPLTPEEKTAIKSFSLKSNLSDKLEYVKIGTTIFNNNTDQIIDPDMYQIFMDQLCANLRARGYEVITDDTKTTHTLIIDPVVTRNEPSGYGVHGAGWFVHTAFGYVPPVTAQISINVKLLESGTENVRYAWPICVAELTSVNKAPGKWVDFTMEEQSDLLENMRIAMKTAASLVVELAPF